MMRTRCKECGGPLSRTMTDPAIKPMVYAERDEFCSTGCCKKAQGAFAIEEPDDRARMRAFLAYLNGRARIA